MLRYRTLLVAAVFAATAGQVFAGPFGLFHRKRHCRPAPVCPPPCPPPAYQVPYRPSPPPVLALWECRYDCQCIHQEYGEEIAFIVGIGSGATEQQAEDNAKAAADAECAGLGGECRDGSFSCSGPGNGEGVQDLTDAMRPRSGDFRFHIECHDGTKFLIVIRADNLGTARQILGRYIARIASDRNCRAPRTTALHTRPVPPGQPAEN